MPIIDRVHPSKVFAAEDYFEEYQQFVVDPRKVAVPMVVSRHNVDGKWYVLMEIHEPGEVVYRAFEWLLQHNISGKAPSFADKGALGSQADAQRFDAMAVDYETYVQEPTLVIALNAGEGPRGVSDYTRDMRVLQGEINNEVSQIAQHFEELISGGTLVLGRDAKAMILNRDRKQTSIKVKDFGRGNTGEGTLPAINGNETNIIFEGSENKGITRHVSRPVQFEGAFSSLQGFISMFEARSGIRVKRLFDQQQAPESGRAMRLQYKQFVAKAKRKGVRFAEYLEKLWNLALMVAGDSEADVTITFSDPLPLSLFEKLEIGTALAGGQAIMPRKRILTLVFGMDEATADEVLQELEQEEIPLNSTQGVGNFVAAQAGQFPAQEGEQ